MAACDVLVNRAYLGEIRFRVPEHQALLLMLGHQSQRKVLRNRFRTSAAMAAQIREQGLNLGGRPPYGYRLVDAGPHPNEKHAGWGRRRYRLDIDPVSAPHVRWIFARRLAAILANPRYTGRQVWNRQFTDHREAVPGDKRSSLGPVRVWNPRADWVVSAEHTHPPLVSDQDFLTAQQITALALPEDGRTRRYASPDC